MPFLVILIFDIDIFTFSHAVCAIYSCDVLYPGVLNVGSVLSFVACYILGYTYYTLL